MRELQQMMAAILMAREHTAAVAAAAAERPAQGFRWGWDPPGPRRTYNLDCLPATEFTGWKFCTTTRAWRTSASCPGRLPNSPPRE